MAFRVTVLQSRAMMHVPQLPLTTPSPLTGYSSPYEFLNALFLRCVHLHKFLDPPSLLCVHLQRQHYVALAMTWQHNCNAEVLRVHSSITLPRHFSFPRALSGFLIGMKRKEHEDPLATTACIPGGEPPTKPSKRRHSDSCGFRFQHFR